MKSHLHNYRAWTAAILLVAMAVPRRLLAADIRGGAQQPPCYGIEGQEIFGFLKSSP